MKWVERRIEILKMWTWRRMAGVSQEDRLRNETLRRIGGKRSLSGIIQKVKMNWSGHKEKKWWE